jgi:hypothetical protein
MFRALLTHPQESLQNRHFVYYILSATCVAPPEDEQVMLATCRGINSE